MPNPCYALHCHAATKHQIAQQYITVALPHAAVLHRTNAGPDIIVLHHANALQISTQLYPGRAAHCYTRTLLKVTILCHRKTSRCYTRALSCAAILNPDLALRHSALPYNHQSIAKLRHTLPERHPAIQSHHLCSVNL